MVIGDELGAELAPGLLVRGGQEDEIALERDPGALQRQHGRQMQDARRLHVDRAPAVEVTGGDHAAERVHRPVTPVGVDDVDMVMEHDPAERPVAREARLEARASGRRLDRLARDALARQDLGQEPRAGDLVARRVRGVDHQVATEQVDRLVAQRGPVHQRVSASGIIASTSPSSQRAM